MSSAYPGNNPTAYLGVGPTYPGNIWFRPRAPNNALDVHNYNRGDTWINTAVPGIWMLQEVYNVAPPGTKVANWLPITGAGAGVTIDTLSADGGVTAFPVGANCRILGDAAHGISTIGVAPDTIQVTAADATLATKGVAQFDPAYFLAAGGVISLVGVFSFIFSPAAPGQLLTPDSGWWTTGPTTFVLPVVAPAGSIIIIQGAGGAWQINQDVGQQIFFNATTATTLGAAGTTSSTDAYDGLTLLCTTANTTWVAYNIKGNILPA